MKITLIKYPLFANPPLNQKRLKTTKKRSDNSPQVEPERRTARAVEQSFEVVFEFLIFRLDLLFLLHQGKRKEYFHENYSH
ncbi:hypothetical protein IWX83_003168 [Flavobacterium sp. CG_9.1]|nr:hypothetical protein [Flavobacterium sp. CG_9.1]